MKILSIVVLFFSILVIGFTGCKKDTQETCNLNATSVSEGNMTITFTAKSTGDGTISSLTYTTSETTETITNPTLPWSIQSEAVDATDVSITATGTVKDGSLTIELDGAYMDNTISSNDFCSHSN